MGRLTHKVDGKYYPSMNNLVQEKDYQSSNYRELIHEKLGRIEDLMENYGIESVEELELIIKDHKMLYNKEIELSADLGMYQNENEHLTKDIEKYWELEQQLGCDLDVIFKALMNGIVDKRSTYTPIDINLGVQLYNGNPTYVIRYIDYDEAETIRSLGFNYFPKYWLLKDYQKTWWLVSDKKEKPNDN